MKKASRLVSISRFSITALVATLLVVVNPPTSAMGSSGDLLPVADFVVGLGRSHYVFMEYPQGL